MLKDLNLNIRKTILKMLYDLAFADGHFHPSELDYLKNVIRELGLEEGEIEKLKWDEFAFKFELPKEENERIKILYHLLFLSKTDDEVNDSEVEYIRSICLKLGLREDLVLDLTDVVKAHIGKYLHPDKLLDIIKKYYN
ncbi:MAG: TerB family tellurite resistance protein [Flavobacteriales bacterium]|nr:TerB family tellurite resistance protein [Flavobacteriales bacterium]